jgi:hypothetical protein
MRIQRLVLCTAAAATCGDKPDGLPRSSTPCKAAVSHVLQREALPEGRRTEQLRAQTEPCRACAARLSLNAGCHPDLEVNRNILSRPVRDTCSAARTVPGGTPPALVPCWITRRALSRQAHMPHPSESPVAAVREVTVGTLTGVHQRGPCRRLLWSHRGVHEHDVILATRMARTACPGTAERCGWERRP